MRGGVDLNEILALIIPLGAPVAFASENGLVRTMQPAVARGIFSPLFCRRSIR
jgi:hypothetical protein